MLKALSYLTNVVIKVYVCIHNYAYLFYYNVIGTNINLSLIDEFNCLNSIVRVKHSNLINFATFHDHALS